jgi:ribosomal protein S18 acetylase RimI-like enzyme
MDATIRPALPNRADGEQFAHYADIASDGLFRWMLGKRFVTVVGKAFLEPGHDLSHEHVWFAQSDSALVGMVSVYSAADHEDSRDAPLFRAAGVRSIRLAAASLAAGRLFQFMDRVPEGDWYLQAVAVGQAYRGAGIGSLLLDHAELTASGRGGAAARAGRCRRQRRCQTALRTSGHGRRGNVALRSVHGRHGGPSYGQGPVTSRPVP